MCGLVLRFFYYLKTVVFSFQTVLKFGPWKCECHTPQQPSQVSQMWACLLSRERFPSTKLLILCFPKQVCVQRRIWEVQTLYDYNTNVWCRHLPIPFQLPVRREISIINVILWRKLCRWSLTCRCHIHRVTDEIFNFLLVWYYCTLTIRESILMSNGSRWVHIHFKIHLVNAVT